MKKVLLVFVSFGMLSCSSEETKRVSSNEIVGKWHLIHSYEEGQEIINQSCNAEYNINEYNENGTAIIKYADRDSKDVCKQYTENETYTIEDGILTETQKNGSVIIYEAKFKIKESTTSTLKLEDISVFEANNDGSNPVKYDFTDGESLKVYNKIH